MGIFLEATLFTTSWVPRTDCLVGRVAAGEAAGLSLASPEGRRVPGSGALGSGWTLVACRVMVLEVFCRMGVLRAFLGESPGSSSLGSLRDGGWLFGAQDGGPPLWVLEKFLLSAAAPRLSSLGPGVTPLATSFLISELAAFVPLNADLGVVAGGQRGRRRRNRMIIWLLTSTDSRDHRSPWIKRK